MSLVPRLAVEEVVAVVEVVVEGEEELAEASQVN